MAGAMRKMAVYLGLVEDQDSYADYDEYDEYEDARRSARTSSRGTDRYSGGYEDRYGTSSVRTIRDESPRRSAPQNAPRPANVAPVDFGRIHTIHPRSYNDARSIGEEFRNGVPVVMNLSELDDNDAKRIVDFAAGLIFGLHGSIERITNKVFLLSPANVDVASQARAQLAEDGFFNQS